MVLNYGISITDNDTTQSECGVLLLTVVNYNGVLQFDFVSTTQANPTSMLGSLTVTPTCVLDGTTLYAIIKINSSISPSRIAFNAILNNLSSYKITKI